MSTSLESAGYTISWSMAKLISSKKRMSLVHLVPKAMDMKRSIDGDGTVSGGWLEKAGKALSPGVPGSLDVGLPFLVLEFDPLHQLLV